MREYKRKKNGGEIQIWERGKKKQVLDGMRGRRCRMGYEERESIEHMWNGCSEMRDKEGR
jgi:hypothetical protein